MTTSFDYESVTWGGGGIISPDAWDFLDHSLHLRYALDALKGVSGRAIEIGCGSGRFIASLAAARPDLDAHGCDLSAAALQVAGRAQVQMVRGDATALPYLDGQFGGVLMVDVLEHLPDLDKGLAEVRRILAPGGVFHLVFPCEGHPWTLLGRIDRLQALKREHAGHIQRFGPGPLKARLRAAGLKPIDERYSYHALGQLYDAAIYIALGRGINVHKARQTHVEAAPSSGINKLRLGVSRLLYLEARSLSRLPLGMTIHVTCT